MDDGGQYDCEIEADGDLPISVSHRLDILLPPRVIVIIMIYIISIVVIMIILIIKSFIINDGQVVSEPADGRVVVKKGSSVTIKCLTRYVRIFMSIPILMNKMTIIMILMI